MHTSAQHKIKMKFTSYFLSGIVLLLMLNTLVNCSSEKKTTKEKTEITRNKIWEHYDIKGLSDSTAIDMMLTDYLLELASNTPSIAKNELNQFLQKASKNRSTLQYFSERLKQHLYDPNSSLFNEQYYDDILEYLIADTMTSNTERIRMTIIQDNIRKNKVGSKARDFTFTTFSGEKSHLYKTNDTYKLVLFFDPGCAHCFETIIQLKSSDVLSKLLIKKAVDVYTICPFDTKQSWLTYKPYLLPQWTNGINEDQTIFNKALYYFIAYPTLYVLDKNNTVILKDPTLEEALTCIMERSK